MNNTQYQGFEVCHIALEERLRQKLQQAHKDKCKELSLANLSLETFPGAFEVLPEDVAMLKQVISQTETGEEIESKDVLPKGEDACPRVTPLEKALRPLLIHLESIDLSNNDLTSYDSFPSTRLPSAVRCLSSLKSLTLRNNNLDRLPSFLFNLTWLQSLRLDLNALQTLKGFHHMTSLTELNVLMNEIEGNVKQLAALTNLQVLVLGMNHITRLPKLNRLTGLRSLHLNDNKLGTGKQRPKRKDTPPSAALPQSPSSSTRVSEFERLLSRLPPHSLADLVLGGNLLGPEIPSSIGAFKALTRLDVSRNGITTFPDSLFELAQLRALSLSRNAITLVPPALSRLTQLSHLRLDGNNISCLEEECFLSLTQLQILEAQANQIHTFPTFTLKLISYSLRELDLSNNCIEALPEDETLLLALSKLSKLRLSYNLFETIPSCLRGYPAFASYASAFTAQQIITGLYIGGVEVARNKGLLRKYNITHILNASVLTPSAHFPDDFKYLILDADDSMTQDMLQHFSTCHLFINEALQTGGCLIHCQAGISRSATILISYLMYSSHLRLDEALRIVQEKRPQICPNPNFLNQLRRYEALLFSTQNSADPLPAPGPSTVAGPKPNGPAHSSSSAQPTEGK